jgi:septum site-determining protein MinD
MKKIVVTSGKGGAGKTTVTASLGVVLASRGYRIVLVDADVGLNNLDVALGVENKLVYDLADVIAGRCTAAQALIKAGSRELYVLPSAVEPAGMTAQSFRAALDGISNCDYMLIDCPAGIEHGFHRAVSAADRALVVATPAVSSIRDADKVFKLLSAYRLESVSLIINRIDASLVKSGEMMCATDISRLLSAIPVGIIPEDRHFCNGAPLIRLPENVKTQKALNILADNVVNDTYKAFDYLSRGIFKRRRA